MNNQGVKQVIALLCEWFRYDSYENNEAANNFVFSACFEWSVVRKALGQHITWRGWEKKTQSAQKAGSCEKKQYLFLKDCHSVCTQRGQVNFLQKQPWFWHNMVSVWTWFCSIHIGGKWCCLFQKALILYVLGEEEKNSGTHHLSTFWPRPNRISSSNLNLFQTGVQAKLNEGFWPWEWTKTLLDGHSSTVWKGCIQDGCQKQACLLLPTEMKCS